MLSSHDSFKLRLFIFAKSSEYIYLMAWWGFGVFLYEENTTVSSRVLSSRTLCNEGNVQYGGHYFQMAFKHLKCGFATEEPEILFHLY